MDTRYDDTLECKYTKPRIFTTHTAAIGMAHAIFKSLEVNSYAVQLSENGRAERSVLYQFVADFV